MHHWDLTGAYALRSLTNPRRLETMDFRGAALVAYFRKRALIVFQALVFLRVPLFKLDHTKSRFFWLFKEAAVF